MSNGEDVQSDDASVSAQVPESLKRAIRIEAARQDRPMAELIRETLREWADENGLDVDLDTVEIEDTSEQPADD